MSVLYLLLGFAVLFAGGELLVKGAAGLALRAKIAPMVVGLTVVSLGTSAPELFAALQAATLDKADISVGTVVGSNIANLALVLAVTVLIFPIPVERKVLKLDWPMMMLATVIFYLFGMDGELGLLNGVTFVILLVAFTSYLIIRSLRKKGPQNDDDDDSMLKNARYNWFMLGFFVIGGCVGLYFGSEWFLRGAVSIAGQFGVSDHVIGVTVVAFGTSVPELAASGIAALRRQTDISLGNLIGSNIFNILGVLGVTSIITPLGVSGQVLFRDYFWMVGVSLLLFPIVFFGKKISRLNGITLLSIYILYVYLLVF